MPDINIAYNWAINKCNDSNVRYSMDWDKRDGVIINNLQYYDCSSFIFWALDAGGFPVVSIFGNHAFNTDSMGAVLLQVGFVTVPVNGELRPGDIGVHHRGSAGGHTEMCYQGGMGQGIFMGAHGSSLAPQNQVSINSYTTQGNNWSEIYRYGGGASGQSLSLYVISAICGNWWAESNVNPGIYEGLNVVPLTDNNVYGGYGLGQWTNNPPSLTRRTDLANWLSANGYAMDDGNGQIMFLIHEDYWTPTSIQPSAYQTLTDFLNSGSTDIDELTKEYMYHWEGINNGTLATRQQRAHQVYNYLLDHFGDTGITWITGNRYLTEAESLNNCVLAAQFLASWFVPGVRPFLITLFQRHILRRRRLII